MKIEQRGEKWVLLDPAGEVIATYDSEGEAQAALDAQTAQEASATSASLEERPFVVDGVELDEAQVRSLANLVAGCSRRGVRTPLSLPEALALWRRHNLVVTESSGKRRWRVHSASPTFREEEPKPAPLSFEGAFLEADPEGKSWVVCLIREGWSANGRYYPADVLERALPLFEQAPIAIYGWHPEQQSLGHLPPQVRSAVPDGLAANIVGWAEGVYGDRDEAGRFEVRATFHCTDGRLAKTLTEAWNRGKRDLLGFSIDAVGETQPGTAEGRRGHIVRAITAVHETTVVSNPAAGGRYLRLVAAIERSPEMNWKLLKSKLRELRLRAGKDASGVDKIEEGAPLMEALLKEMDASDALVALALDFLAAGKTEEAMAALQKLLDMAPAKVEVNAPADPFMMDEAKRKMSELDQELARMKQARCAAELDRQLAESKLPEKAQATLRKRFEGQVFEAAALTEAIQEVRDLLASAEAPAGVVQPRVEGIAETRDKLQAALDLCCGFDPSKANLSEAQKSIYQGVRNPRFRQIYQIWTDDQDIRGRYGPAALQEAGTTADMPTALGTSMEKAMVQKYLEMTPDWDPLVYINPDVNTFKTQDRILWGGFAGLPTKAEGAAYADIGFPREEKAQYSLATRGGLVYITREMIKNDDMSMLRDLPNRIAAGARNQLNKFVFGLLVGNAAGGAINTDTTYDAKVIYHADHLNLATGALDYSTFVAARRQLQNQKNFGVSTLMNDSGGISNSDTAVTVVSTTGIRAGDYIQIEAEIIKVAAITSATVLDITGGRAALGTSAAAHADATRVYQLADPIPLRTIYAVVPYELEATLAAILGSDLVPGSANNDINFLNMEVRAGRIKHLAVPSIYLGADLNNWYLAAPAAEIVSLELAFMDNRREPELLVQDAPTEGLVWTNDQITYKARHEYGGKAVDYRGLQGNIVS